MFRLAFAAAAAAIVSFVVGQAPWPLERQDRWGTARALTGPAPGEYVSPWVLRTLSPTYPVSHGPSLGEGGIGYFGNWVQNNLHRFDLRTGEQLGSFQALSFVACTPAIGIFPRLFVTTDGPSARMFALNATVLEYDWFMTTGYVGGSPTVGPDGDVVFATASGTAFRVDDLAGGIVWQRPLPGGARATVLFSRDDLRVFVANGSFMTALSYADGSILWSTPLGSLSGSPGVAPDGTVVVGTDGGMVYGLDSATGGIRWSRAVLAQVRVAPAFSSDGVAYVASYDHRIYALRTSDGARLWSFTSSYWVTHPPVMGHDGRIYFLNQPGDLYCIDTNGALVWQVHLNGTEYNGSITLGPDGTLFVPYWNGVRGGLAIIRQLPAVITPDSFQFTSGTYVSGGVPELSNSDDQYVLAHVGSVLVEDEPYVTLFVRGTCPTSQVHKLTLSVEASASQEVPQAVYMWNWQNSVYELLDRRIATFADSKVSITIRTNPNRFISPGSRQLECAVIWGTSAADLDVWTSRTDMVRWTAEPVFQL